MWQDSERYVIIFLTDILAKLTGASVRQTRGINMTDKALHRSETNEFHDIHFDSIQILRGITALFIILEHIRFLNCGAFGVDIFFCLSGFVIMSSTHKSTEFFLRKRLARILPLYYILTLGTYAALLLLPDMFAQSRAEPEFLIKSLLFIPFDIGGGVLQPLMRVGWTINCEIFFYLLFAAANRISHKYRGLVCSGFLLALVGAAGLLPTAPVPLQFYGNPVMLEFILGILAYYAARGIYRLHTAGRLPRFCPALGLTGAACAFLGLLVTKPGIDIEGFRRPLVWGLPALFITLCFFVWGLSLKKAPGSLVLLGDISFSLYLIHYYPVMFMDRFVFDFSVCTPAALFGTAVAIAVSTLLALVSHALIEQGLSGWLRDKICQKNS